MTDKKIIDPAKAEQRGIVQDVVGTAITSGSRCRGRSFAVALGVAARRC